MNLKRPLPAYGNRWITKFERLDLYLGQAFNRCGVWPLICQPFRWGSRYPSDVLVGALLGWLLARLSLAVHLPLLLS